MNPINSMKPALPPTPHRSVAPARQMRVKMWLAPTVSSLTTLWTFKPPFKLTPASLSAASNSLNPTADILIVDFAYFNYCLVIASGKKCVLIVLQSYLDEISLGVQFPLWVRLMFFCTLLKLKVLRFTLHIKNLIWLYKGPQVFDVTL